MKRIARWDPPHTPTRSPAGTQEGLEEQGPGWVHELRPRGTQEGKEPVRTMRNAVFKEPSVAYVRGLGHILVETGTVEDLVDVHARDAITATRPYHNGSAARRTTGQSDRRRPLPRTRRGRAAPLQQLGANDAVEARDAVVSPRTEAATGRGSRQRRSNTRKPASLLVDQLLDLNASKQVDRRATLRRRMNAQQGAGKVELRDGRPCPAPYAEGLLEQFPVDQETAIPISDHVDPIRAVSLSVSYNDPLGKVVGLRLRALRIGLDDVPPPGATLLSELHQLFTDDGIDPRRSLTPWVAYGYPVNCRGRPAHQLATHDRLGHEGELDQ